jgi:hypothetical protein
MLVSVKQNAAIARLVSWDFARKHVRMIVDPYPRAFFSGQRFMSRPRFWREMGNEIVGLGNKSMHRDVPEA